MKITDVKTIRLRATIPTEGQVFSRSGVRNIALDDIGASGNRRGGQRDRLRFR